MAIDIGSYFTNFVQGNTLTYLVNGVWITMLIAILVFVGFFVFVFMRYNVQVLILERVGEGVRVLRDKAGVFTKNKISTFRLMKKKAEITPPKKSDYFMFGKKKFLFLYEAAEGMFTPIKLAVNSPATFHPLDQDIKFWFVQEHKRTEEIYNKQGFWERYGNWVISIGVLAICFVLILFVLKYVSEMVGVAAGATSGIKDAIVELGKQRMI